TGESSSCDHDFLVFSGWPQRPPKRNLCGLVRVGREEVPVQGLVVACFLAAPAPATRRACHGSRLPREVRRPFVLFPRAAPRGPRSFVPRPRARTCGLRQPAFHSCTPPAPVRCAVTKRFWGEYAWQ